MFRFLIETATAGTGQRVEFRAPPELARFPLGRNPASQFQLVERGVKRPVADLELLVRHFLESLADGPSVLRFERDDLQQQQVERSLDEIWWFAHGPVS